MVRKYQLAVLAVVLCLATLAILYFYPRILKTGGKTLEERFRALYSEDPDFKTAVDELRSMVLDPEAPFDKGKAISLFNTVLGKLGLPAIDPVHFNYGKSVTMRAGKLPEPVNCSPPVNLKLTVVQPRIDVEGNNGLEKVYACSYELNGKKVVEVTLVFANERSPGATLQDTWYEAWRLVSWGRSRDVETFFLVQENGKTYVDFSGLALILQGSSGLRLIKGIGSGGKTFTESVHEEGRFEVSSVNLTIYVNTYNHALGLEDSNPSMEKATFTYYEGYFSQGRRLDVENVYSDIKYSGELVNV